MLDTLYRIFINISIICFDTPLYSASIQAQQIISIGERTFFLFTKELSGQFEKKKTKKAELFYSRKK